MTLMHWIESPDGAHRGPSELGYAYRIADEPTWRSWLAKVTGRDDAQLEVVQRRLRVADDATRQSPVTMPAAQAAPVRQAAVKIAAQPQPATAGPVESATGQPVATAEAAPERTAAVAAQAPDPVTDAVLDVVESLTGYPRDLLDLDLDLEADLGVDTVKQAEVFAAVRERFAIPRLDSLKLRDFPTLTHVIGFAREHAPQAAAGRRRARRRAAAAAGGREPSAAAGIAGAARGHGHRAGRRGRGDRRRSRYRGEPDRVPA